MKMTMVKNNMNPSFGIRSINSLKGIENRTLPKNKLIAAFKDVSAQFKSVNEIGHFEKIKVDIMEPMADISIKKARLELCSSANPRDFRTRVLSFIAYSPKNEKVKYSVTQAVGNQFAIDSVLKNPTIVTSFKSFLKDAERFFYTNRS